MWILIGFIALAVAAFGLQVYWQHQEAKLVELAVVATPVETVEVVATPIEPIKPAVDFSDTGKSWTDKVRAAVGAKPKAATPKPKPVVAEAVEPVVVAEQTIVADEGDDIIIAPHKYGPEPGIFTTSSGRKSLTARQERIAARRVNLSTTVSEELK